MSDTPSNPPGRAKPPGKPGSGPGLVVAAAFIGPGTVTTATVAGANFGYTLLWALLFATLATICLQYIAARSAILTRKGLAEAMLASVPPGAARFAMATLVLVALALGNAAYEAGNISGGYLGLEAVVPAVTGAKQLAIAAIALGLIALVALGDIPLLQRLLVALVALMSLAFLTALVLVPPDWSALFAGFVPRLPDAGLFTAIALIGTTIVPYNLFLHAAMARDRWQGADDLGELRRDSVLSISLGGLVSMAVVATAATAFFTRQVEIGSAADMAMQLEPLFGDSARILIGCGLMAAGITSALTAPMATGYVVSEIASVFGIEARHGPLVFKGTAIAVIATGAISAIANARLVDLILTAQVANGMLLPLVAILLFRIANSANLPREQRNGTGLNLAAIAVIGVTLLLGFRLIAKAVGLWP